jgi:GNAT superfamily N-acetyltransferase
VESSADWSLVELAEEPGLWLPPQPGHDVVIGDGFAFVTHGRSAWVHRVRLDGDGVAPAVEQVRALLRATELDEVTWWIGEHSTPSDLVPRLEALGLEDDEPPAMTTLAIDAPPVAEKSVEVRRVESLDEYLVARQIDWTAFDVPVEEQDERRAFARAGWPPLAADGREVLFVAHADGQPVGFGRVVFTPTAGLLLGGATLPEARGRGVYSALVLARWREAAARGIPRLVTAAGPMSAPILRKLGFTQLGSVQLLRDRL